MGIRAYKPTSAGRRFYTVSDFAEITTDTPEKSLVEHQPQTGGRNHYGRITSRFRGGGHKQKYRIIDFKRRLWDVAGTVERLEYDPNRSAFIALISYEGGEQAYIIAPQRLAPGDKVIAGNKVDVKPGNAMEIGQMPVGTIITDLETESVIGELLEPGERILLCKGGDGGFGNLHFKTSTNRAPRQKTPGWPGEVKKLRLELRVLADVGLLGQPNAGKSTLITAVSNAKPKIADYPFTTLHPNLGVVRVAMGRSFVVADIPGLIEGAAEGAGLGHQFLRHLQRTRLLLHVVDLAPFDDSDPVAQARAIVAELKKYDPGLHKKPRWLVLNKLDMVPAEERAERVRDFVRRLRWKGPVHRISGLARQGTRDLMQALMRRLDELTAGAA